MNEPERHHIEAKLLAPPMNLSILIVQIFYFAFGQQVQRLSPISYAPDVRTD
jgi:hypothetical protein